MTSAQDAGPATSKQDHAEDKHILTMSQTRPAGRSNLYMLLGWGALIKYPIQCEGHDIEAIIDTGAFASVISLKEAEKYNFQLKPTEENLCHAAGEQLDVVGEVMVNVSITIGTKTMATTHNLVVVRNFCAPMVLGIELMRIFKLTVDVCADQPLAFHKSVFDRGVRTVSSVTLPARSATVVNTKVATSAKLIATIPFNFDRSVLLANSVSPVKNMET